MNCRYGKCKKENSYYSAFQKALKGQKGEEQLLGGGGQISQGEGSLSSDFKRDQKIIKGASGRQQGLVP